MLREAAGSRMSPNSVNWSREIKVAASTEGSKFRATQSTQEPQGSTRIGRDTVNNSIKSIYSHSISTSSNNHCDLLWEQRVAGSNPSARPLHAEPRAAAHATHRGHCRLQKPFPPKFNPCSRQLTKLQPLPKCVRRLGTAHAFWGAGLPARLALSDGVAHR